MIAQIIRDRVSPGAWRVEKLDADDNAGVAIAVFYGPDAYARATRYANMEYGGRFISEMPE